MRMYRWRLLVRHMGEIETVYVVAPTRDDAMGCVCGVVISCEQCD